MTNKSTVNLPEDYVWFLSCLPAGAAVSDCKILGDIYYYHFTWDALHGGGELFYAGPVSYVRGGGRSWVAVGGSVSMMDGSMADGQSYCGPDKGRALEAFVGAGGGEILRNVVGNRDIEPVVRDENIGMALGWR